MRRLVALLMVLAALPALAYADRSPAAVTPKDIGGIPTCRNARVFCVDQQPGSEYSEVCDAAPGTPGAPACQAGTALQAVKDAETADPTFCSPTTPCEIRIGPGVYPEVITASNITDVSFIGAGVDVTIIRPVVTTDTTVQGGVFRIGTAAGSFNALRIEVAQLTVQNDAFSSPESAFQIGQEGGPTAGDATWDDVRIHDFKAIGHHDAVQWFGSGNVNATDLPRIQVYDGVAIGGRDNVVSKGWSKWTVNNVQRIVQSNYCESTDSSVYGQRSGTVVSASDESNVTLANSEVATAHVLVGRVITFAGGSCPVNGEKGRISAYTSGRVATLTLGLSDVPDSNCTYIIAAVGGQPADAPCQDIDWTVIAAQSGSGSWKFTCGHDSTSQVSVNPPAGDFGEMMNSPCTLELNDFGPLTTTNQDHIACDLIYNTAATDARNRGFRYVNIDCRMYINSDPVMIPAPFVPMAACFEFDDGAEILSGGPMWWSGYCYVENNGDPNATVAGIAADAAAGLGNVIIPWANIDFGGTSAAEYHLMAGGATTLTRGDITSTDPINISGSPGLLPGASASSSATLDFGSITSDCVEVVNGGGAATVTVPGAAAGDSCYVGHQVTVLKSDFTCRVTGANTVTVKHCCNNGTCDPASGTFSATVTRR